MPPSSTPPSPDESSSSSSSSSSSEEAYHVRMKAYTLLNSMKDEKDEQETEAWPLRPHLSSYQNTVPLSNRVHTAHGPHEHRIHQRLQEDDSWSSLVVNCVSEACKLGATEIVAQPSALLQSGYATLKSAVFPEVEDRIVASRRSSVSPRGTFDSVPVPRYQDIPDFAMATTEKTKTNHHPLGNKYGGYTMNV